MEHIIMQKNNSIKAFILIVGFSVIGLSQSVLAAPASLIVWDAKTRNLLKQADIGEGEKIAQTCNTCHGVDGTEATTLLDGFPSLSGQRSEYIFKQLMDYKQGKREGLGIMPNFAANLDEVSMASVAVWFSQQELPQRENIKSNVTAAVKKMVYKGDSARFVPACSGCHGLDGEGSIVDVPALAGMSPSYFTDTMNRLKKGQRHNDIYKRMRLIAKELSDQEITDLAHYYNSIGQ